MTEKKLSFEELPTAIGIIADELRVVKELLLERGVFQQQDSKEKLLSIREAANFLNLAIPTIYTKVSKGELPYMKRGKRLYFSIQELSSYIKDGRKLTNAEIGENAGQYLVQNKRR